MNEQAHLERSYRRLLSSFPRGFRDQHGEEMLSVLLACAPNGERRPSFSTSVNLIGSGLSLRLRPGLPHAARTVRAAVRLMYAGAGVTILSLIAAIVSLAFTGGSGAALRLGGRIQPLWVTTAVGIATGIAMIGLWLWMARANSTGRNWARILSTVLAGLETVHLFGKTGAVDEAFAVLSWLIGVAAVWLLWRPASSEFFKPRAVDTPRGIANS